LISAIFSGLILQNYFTHLRCLQYTPYLALGWAERFSTSPTHIVNALHSSHIILRTPEVYALHLYHLRLHLLFWYLHSFNSY